MTLLSSIFFFFTIILTRWSISAQELNCDSIQTNVNGSFPDEMLLGYGESRVISLLDYWKGVNLTYSIENSEDLPDTVNISLPNKIQQVLNGSFESLMSNLYLGKVVDIFLDSKSNPNLSEWAQSVLLVILAENEGNYSLTIGNISSLTTGIGYQTFNLTDSLYQFKCFKATYIGQQFNYYVDCVGREVDGPYWFNFFFYVDASNGLVHVNSTGNNFPQPIMTLKRQLKYVQTLAPVDQFVIRYYRGFDLNTSYPTSFEIWNVANPLEPIQTNFYNGSNITMFNNISTIDASINLLYITTCSGNVYIILDWKNPINWTAGEFPNIIDTMSFPKMIIRSSNLLYPTNSNNNIIQDTLILIGDNENTQYLAMIIQSFSTGNGIYFGSTFDNYFNLPLPIYNKSLFVDIMSIAQTTAFFVISYNVSALYSQHSCSYTSVFQFSGPPNSCHSLIPYENKTVMDYSMFSPFPLSANTFLAISKDNSFVVWEISSPYLYLTNMTENVTLDITVDQIFNQITLIVLPPNSTKITTGEFTSSISRKGPSAAFLLDSGYNGPSVKYYVQILNNNIPYAIYSDHLINVNWPPSVQSLVAFHDNYVERNGIAKLFFLNNGKMYISYAELSSMSLYNIDQINFFYTFGLDLNFKKYFSLNGVDILLADYHNKTHILFADLKFVIKEMKIYFNMSLDEYVKNCSNYEMQAIGNYFSLLCVENGYVNNLTFSSNPYTFLSSYQIPNEIVSISKWANPIIAKMHPDYPYTMFVLCENNVFIITNITLFNLVSLNSYSSFPIPTVDPQNPAILQPFLNKLFLIYPNSNLIYEYDITNLLMPYYVRSIGLFSYDLNIIFTDLVYQGFTYSPITNILYLVANETNTGNIEMLVLTPDNANSYLVDNILIAYNEELTNSSNIAIDCTTLSQGTLGDLVAIVVGGELQLYEIYASASLVIGIPEYSNMSMNEIYSIEINATNPWSNTNVTSLFNLTVYDDEVLINQISTELTFPFHSTSISFPINEFFSGTIYGVESNTDGLVVDPIISKTPTNYILNNSIADFPVVNSWVTPNNIYMLGANSISIFSVTNNKTLGTAPYDNSQINCDDIVIDQSEAFGVVSCTFQNGSRGVMTFFVETFPSSVCSVTALEDFKQLEPSEENLLIFFLTGVGQNASIVTVHGIVPGGCLIHNALFSLPEWLLPTNNPNLTAFDVLFSNISIYEIFIVNSNYGLNIINLDVAVENQFVELIWSGSFEAMFGEWLLLPEDLAILDISVVQKEKIHVETTFTIQLLLVFENYHSFMLTLNISSNFENIVISDSKKVFMLPQEFQVLDWSLSSSYLALIVLNSTEENQQTYTLFYNIFDNQSFYHNRQSLNDPNVYISLTWLYPMTDSSNGSGPLSNIPNLIFLYDCFINSTYCNQTNTTTMMYFTDVNNQEITTYNIYQNLTMSWEGSDDIATNEQFYLKMYNNLETRIYYVPFIDVPPWWSSWWVISLFSLMFIVLVFLIRYIYRRFKSKHVVIFSRKKQTDPLKFLLDLHGVNETVTEKDESLIH